MIHRFPAWSMYVSTPSCDPSSLGTVCRSTMVRFHTSHQKLRFEPRESAGVPAIRPLTLVKYSWACHPVGGVAVITNRTGKPQVLAADDQVTFRKTEA
jgi:hypothetical protein